MQSVFNPAEKAVRYSATSVNLGRTNGESIDDIDGNPFPILRYCQSTGFVKTKLYLFTKKKNAREIIMDFSTTTISDSRNYEFLKPITESTQKGKSPTRSHFDLHFPRERKPC